MMKETPRDARDINREVTPRLRRRLKNKKSQRSMTATVIAIEAGTAISILHPKLRWAKVPISGRIFKKARVPKAPRVKKSPYAKLKKLKIF